MKTLLFVLAISIFGINSFANEDLPPVKPGDVVISVNGKKMKNNLMAMKAINTMKPGSHVNMEVLRDNKIQKITYDVK